MIAARRLCLALSLVALACSDADADDETALDTSGDASTAGPGSGSVDDGPSTTSTGTTATQTTTDGDVTSGADSSGTDDGEDTSEPVPGCGEDPEPTEFEQMLVDMPADTWLEVPDTSFGAICAVPGWEYLHGVEGCGAVINDWCGGVWDPNHGQLLLWGGGHDGYWGNEVWGFDPSTMQWSVVKEPSANITPDNQNKDPLDDGTPVSRHTYGGMVYLADDDLFWAWGGSMARSGSGTHLTWTLDVESGEWTNLQPEGAPYVAPTGPYSMSTAYDPVSRNVFLQLDAGVSRYEIDTNTWVPLLDAGFEPLWSEYTVGSGAAVVDPVRRLFFAFGTSTLGPIVYDIDNAAHASEAWVTTGADAIVESYAVGVDYDPATDQMVAWAGGTPCELDMDTREWTCLNGAGAPATQNPNGTFGRWRYLSAYNVFILVNTPEQNVYFYKHSAGCG